MKRIFIFLFLFCSLFAQDFAEFELEISKEDLAHSKDRYQAFNRRMTKLNVSIYKGFAKPVVITYQKLTPRPARRGISNFFRNLTSPLRVLSSLVALEFKQAGKELLVFAGNSTLGFAGFFDLYGKYSKDSDFALAITCLNYKIKGKYKAPSYLVLPLFGPSTVANLASTPIDMAANGKSYLKWPFSGLSYINDLSLSPATQELERLINPYPLLKDLYEKNRYEKFLEFCQ